MDTAEIKKNESGQIDIIGTLGFGKILPLLQQSEPLFDGKTPLLFDLKGVEKTDSAGLALLVEWMSLAKKKGQDIAFTNIPKQMLDIARVSGLDAVLPVS
jgi:phospholipid transport system transporter-binding protein